MARHAEPQPVLDGLLVGYVVDFSVELNNGDVYDNRASADPVWVEIEAMDPHEAQREVNAATLRLQAKLAKRKHRNKVSDDALATAAASRMDDVRNGLISKRVKTVQNWTCPSSPVRRPDGSIEVLPALEPKNGAELVAALYDPRVKVSEREAILNDLHAAIVDASHLDDGDKKKFASLFVSSSGDSKPQQATSANGAAMAAADLVAPIQGSNPSPTNNGASSTTATVSQTGAPSPGTAVSSAAPGPS